MTSPDDVRIPPRGVLEDRLSVCASSRSQKTLAETFSVPQLGFQNDGRVVFQKSESPTLSRELFAIGVRLSDLLGFLISCILASKSSEKLGVVCSGGEWALTTLLTTLVAVLSLYQTDVYEPNRLRFGRQRLPAIFVSVVLGGVGGLCCFAMMPVSTPVLCVWPAIWMPVAFLVTVTSALMTSAVFRRLEAQDRLTRRVAVLGDTPYGRSFIEKLIAENDPATSVVGLFTEWSDRSNDQSNTDTRGDINDLLILAIGKHIDDVVLTLPLSDVGRIAAARAALCGLNSDIYIAADLFDIACKSRHLHLIGSNVVVKISSRPLSDWQLLQKGVVDRILAFTLICVMMPLLALIAVAVKCDSNGPVLFRQPRFGFNNNLFSVYKFRTMYEDQTDVLGSRQTTPNDSRITRVGRLLRKTSLDELPQLFNVLCGDMSLVGPRPHAPNTRAGNQLFHEVVAGYASRHRVKPGITGWAQVNGWRGETRTRREIEKRVEFDLYYIDNWSLVFDFRILVLTAVREINSKVAF